MYTLPQQMVLSIKVEYTLVDGTAKGRTSLSIQHVLRYYIVN